MVIFCFPNCQIESLQVPGAMDSWLYPSPASCLPLYYLFPDRGVLYTQPPSLFQGLSFYKHGRNTSSDTCRGHLSTILIIYHSLFSFLLCPSSKFQRIGLPYVIQLSLPFEWGKKKTILKMPSFTQVTFLLEIIYSQGIKSDLTLTGYHHFITREYFEIYFVGPSRNKYQPSYVSIEPAPPHNRTCHNYIFDIFCL